MRSVGRVILGDYVAWVAEYLPSASTSAILESGTQFRTARTNLLKHNRGIYQSLDGLAYIDIR
jgi:hypothetical protein